MMCDIVWGKPYIRIDSMVDRADLRLLHNMYVPLKEQCRKFNAYMHVGILYTDCQQLVLSEDDNKEILSMNPQKLRKCIYAPQYTQWAYGNHFVVPDNW
jgi:hypothetical protein